MQCEATHKVADITGEKRDMLYCLRPIEGKQVMYFILTHYEGIRLITAVITYKLLSYEIRKNDIQRETKELTCGRLFTPLLLHKMGWTIQLGEGGTGGVGVLSVRVSLKINARSVNSYVS